MRQRWARGLSKGRGEKLVAENVQPGQEVTEVQAGP